jgi:hypothetical protein
MHNMRRPPTHPIKDVGRIQNRRSTDLGFFFEEIKQVLADKNVEIDRDFVEEEDFPGFQETENNLDTATLAVRDGVHVPVDINVEDFLDGEIATDEI